MGKNVKYIYRFLSSDLTEVSNVIYNCIGAKEEVDIKTMTDYLLSSGGKRLRPVFVLLSAKLFKYRGDDHINIAAAVECIHSATLLHDDVVDESAMRRGQLTSHQKWGNKRSILVGDFLFSQAFCLMVRTGSLQVLSTLANASAIIAEGEVMQLGMINNLELEIPKYIQMIQSKTAELFAASCLAGAIIADQSQDTCDIMHNFGLNVGVAFQIIDDVLDYTAKTDDLGKNIGDDFYEGKVTYPVIAVYRLSGALEKKLIQDIFSKSEKTEEDLKVLIALMHKHKAFEASVDLASYFIKRCHKTLDELPSNKIRYMFKDILDLQLSRVC